MNTTSTSQQPETLQPETSLGRISEPGAEIFAQCYLAQSIWPESDPQSVEQAVERRSEFHDGILRKAARNIAFPTEGFQDRNSRLSIPEQIRNVLNHDAFQFNPKQAFAADPVWLERLKTRVNRGEPVEIVYPLFTKEGCAAKVMDSRGPTAAEYLTLVFFGHLAAQVSEWYPPGLVVHALADAALYNTAYLNSPVESKEYHLGLLSLVERAHAGRFIRIHDYAELLTQEGATFQRAYFSAHEKLRRDPFALTTESEYWTNLKSIRANINTRVLGLEYADLKAIFGPCPDPKHPAWGTIQTMARRALHEKLAIKAAAYAVQLPEKAFPGAIRATVHKGLKNGRAVLGLRTYPEYYRSTRILPYHGVAWLQPTEGDGWKATVHPEISLRGRSDLTRVVTEEGTTWFYYSPRSVPDERSIESRTQRA